MPEAVSIPHAVRTSHVGESIIAQLIAQEKLPADFYFRLLVHNDDDYGTWGEWKPTTRESIAAQDVLAALNLGEPSIEADSYLHGDLPKAAMIPYGANTRKVVRQLDTHYYIFADLQETADKLTRTPNLARLTWQACFQYANSALFAETLSQDIDLRESMNRQKSRFRSILAHAAIRGDVVVALYQDKEAESLTPAKRELLHYMLLDDHPELGV